MDNLIEETRFTYKNPETITPNFKRIPKFKKGDCAHIVFSNNSYKAVIISKITNNNGYVKYHCSKAFYGGWDDICGYEENLYPRDEFDFSSNDHLIKQTVRENIVSLDFDKLIKVNSDLCQICLSDYDNENIRVKYAFPCGNDKHVFHKSCITKAFKIKQSCPTCRQEADENNFKINGYTKTTQITYLSDDDEWLFD